MILWGINTNKNCNECLVRFQTGFVFQIGLLWDFVNWLPVLVCHCSVVMVFQSCHSCHCSWFAILFPFCTTSPSEFGLIQTNGVGMATKNESFQIMDFFQSETFLVKSKPCWFLIIGLYLFLIYLFFELVINLFLCLVTPPLHKKSSDGLKLVPIFVQECFNTSSLPNLTASGNDQSYPLCTTSALSRWGSQREEDKKRSDDTSAMEFSLREPVYDQVCHPHADSLYVISLFWSSGSANFVAFINVRMMMSMQ